MTDREANLRFALRTYAANLSSSNAPPPAAAVWFVAQQRQRRLAVRRTLFPIHLMYALCVAFAIATFIWLLHVSPNAPQSNPLDAAVGSVLTKWILAAAVLVAVAGWLMLRASRRLFAP